MPAGAPRTRTPETEELIKLGEDLVKWATEETDELRWQFPQWYCLKHGYVEQDFDLMKRKPEFMPYYQKARTALAQRLVNGELKEGISHRLMRIYVPEVRREEDELIAYKAECNRRQEIQHSISEEMQSLFGNAEDSSKHLLDGLDED